MQCTKIAWDTGPQWKKKLESGRERLPETVRAALEDVLRRAAENKARRSTR